MREVDRFIIGCILCYTNKQRLYSPFPISTSPWESIYKKIIGSFPRTRRWHDFMYVVDIFNKMLVFINCKNIIKGKEATILFFERVYVDFRISRRIISYMDTRFLNMFYGSLQ